MKGVYMEILCSTGALIGRPNNRDFRLLEKFSEELTCDGFEFMMFDSWYERRNEIIKYLQGIDLSIPVMHCEKQVGEILSGGKETLKKALELFEINCEMAQALGAEKLVVHLWDGYTSDSSFGNNLEAYGTLAETADKYGVMILVENVVCNVESPMAHWCQLAERYPEIHFVFDTKMAAFHQEETLLYEPAYEWLWRNRHIRHYHVNDYAGGYKEWEKLKTLPIGRGNVDFDRFFDFIRKIGYDETFTVEATAFDWNGLVDTEMLNGCFDKIRSEGDRK